MKKFLVFVISFIILFSAFGCMNNMPKNPDASYGATDTEESSKKPPSSGSAETEDGESSENDENSKENDESSSNEPDSWTGLY